MPINEELKEKIEINKEILSALPVNNRKNKDKYLKQLSSFLNDVNVDLNIIFDEIKRRYNNLSSSLVKKEDGSIDKEIARLSILMPLLEEYNSSYEKMELDKRLHKLKYYYKNNLDELNGVILSCIMKFKELGIILSKDDFNYSIYAKEYISYFLDGVENKKLDLKKIHSSFDDIYWKCPDVITHIELNFREIYLKNKKRIDKKYNEQKENILSKVNGDTVKQNYYNLLRKKELLKKDNAYNIITDFLNGKENTKNYLEDNMYNKYKKYVSEIFLKNIFESEDSSNKKNNLDQNLIDLKDVVLEYMCLLKYEFLINNIKERYNEVKKNKNITKEYNDTIKEINKKEKEIFSITKKDGKGLFSKKADDASLVKQNLIILSLRELYTKLDDINLNIAISKFLSPSSTIYDVLRLISSYYREAFRIIRKSDTERTEEEIDDYLTTLKDFIQKDNLSILNNLNINEEKNLLFVIRDKYNLLNISLTNDMLEKDNLQNLVDDLEEFEKYYYIRKNNIDLKVIDDFNDLKNIVDQKHN